MIEGIKTLLFVNLFFPHRCSARNYFPFTPPISASEKEVLKDATAFYLAVIRPLWKEMAERDELLSGVLHRL